MPLTPGDRLGPYEILEPLGAGGMGEVYKARDTRLDRFVAIKVLPDHIAKREDLRARFEREARTVASLNHPHICVLHDIGPNYMVLELIDGETLESRIQRGALPLETALAYAIQIADALARAHRAGVTHRDIKPGNIMLTRDGIKILDFGLARSTTKPGPTDATIIASLTTEGTVLGTPQYMAPEQFEGKEADARADIWAFGAVVYEMLTGEKAFQGKSYSSLVGAILSAEPAPMAVKPFTPAWLERLVRRCLKKDPEDRYLAMHDIVLDLKSPPVSTNVSGRRPILPWTVATVLFLVIVAVAGLAGLRPTPFMPIYRVSLIPPAETRFMFAVTRGGSAISPDGRRIAFSAGQGENFSIWVRPLDSTEARALPGTVGAYSPFWSPDGRSIGFFADGQLKRIDSDGGSLKTLCTVAQGRGGTWNDSGQILFGSFFDRRIYRVPASGGSAVAITQMDESRGETLHRWPYFLPDGRRFLYLITGSKPELSGIYWGSLDFSPESQPRVRLVDGRSNPAYSKPQRTDSAHLLFVRNAELHAQPIDSENLQTRGESVVIARGVSFLDSQMEADYSVSDSNVLAYGTAPANPLSRIGWYTRQGQFAGVVTEGERNISVRLSPDGGRIAVSRPSPDGDVWVVDIRRGATSRFTFEPGLDSTPVWSPDSRQIVYSSATGITMRAATGGDPTVVRRCSFRCSPADWSRDGRWLLFHELDNSWNLWLAPAEDLSKAVRMRAAPHQELHARFSPDGHYLVYSSNETGRFEIYVSAIREDRTAGARWQLSSKGGILPIWSHDGREVYYLNLDHDRKLMAVRVKTSGSVLEAGIPEELFSTNLPEMAFSLPLSSQPFDVSSDGKRFLILAAADETHRYPLGLIVNWHSLLRR